MWIAFGFISGLLCLAGYWAGYQFTTRKIEKEEFKKWLEEGNSK